MQIQVTELANEDLIDIWLYGYETWGERLADDYLFELDINIQTLLHNPQRYPENTNITPPFRLMPFRSHLIIYEIKNTTILILRVLQKSMDTGSQVKPR